MASHSSSDYLSSLFGLRGKTALITGGTRGIGKGLTIALASAGADIILLARKPSDPTVTSTVAAVKNLGQRCHVYQCDLAQRSDILSVVPLLCEKDGHEIDVFVHCGGIQHRAPAEDFPIDKWDDVLSVNLTAGFLLSRELAKHWLETSLKEFKDDTGNSGFGGKRKKIIFIASVTTFTGSVQIPAYVSSKGAMGSLTRALSNEWMAKGINVNSIAPGYFETDLTQGIRDDGEKERHVLERVPLGRWGVPEEDLNGAVIHLASRSSDFVGGTVYVVDGGFCAR